jgi:hypothetical protein
MNSPCTCKPFVPAGGRRKPAAVTPRSARWSSPTRRKPSSWRSPNPCCGAMGPDSPPFRPPGTRPGPWAGHSPGSTESSTTCATNWTSVGVAGLRGGGGKLATNRRARLVEHAVTSHLVTAGDLHLLDKTTDARRAQRRSMRIRLTLRRDPAEAQRPGSYRGRAGPQSPTSPPNCGRRTRPDGGTAAPSNLSLSIDEAFVAGGMKRHRPGPGKDNLLESGCGPGRSFRSPRSATSSGTQTTPARRRPRPRRGDAARSLRARRRTRILAALRHQLHRTGPRRRHPGSPIPLTSKRHARITVGESIEIVDTNSANGLLMDGLPVTRATLNSSDTVTLGDTELTVVSLGAAAQQLRRRPLIDFNRSPRVIPRFAQAETRAPGRAQAPGPPSLPVHHADRPADDGSACCSRSRRA